MPYKKVLAGASLVLLAFAAAPSAFAANDGDSGAPAQAAPASPSQAAPAQPAPRAHAHRRVMDPAKRAALRAKRQARREARRQARQQMQGTAPN